MIPETHTEENRFLWQRNVVDKYKLVSTEDIKKDLEGKALPCAILAQNIEHDFNLGSIMRAANFFGIFNFYYYGRRKIDRRSCCGVYHYQNVVNLPTINDVKALKDKYVFVGIENNTPNTVPMKDFVYPNNSIFVFGEEQMGLDDTLKELCSHLIEIPSRGSVRSINVAAAAAITINDYVNKYTGT
jgi:tRNA G18 (ribose-2'-O)-methylase SpoU